jgi:addiction module RelB/DinJ family antitoxin
MPKPRPVSGKRAAKPSVARRKSAMIRARVDPALKDRAEATFAEVGLSASTAIALFYTQVVRHRGLPFDVEAGTSGRTAVRPTAWNVLRERSGTVAAPRDWASEHDHYVHGVRKRGS